MDKFEVRLEGFGPGRPGRLYFVVRWLRWGQQFDVQPISNSGPLRFTSPAPTGDHVLHLLAVNGYQLYPSAMEELMFLDQQVRAAVGDPILVGDPDSGDVGIATPDQKHVQPLWPLPPGGYRWTDLSDPPAVRHTAWAVLSACAPVSFAPFKQWLAKRPQQVAMGAFYKQLFPAAPNLGWNVRAVQDWAIVAADPTGADRAEKAADLLAKVTDVDPDAIDTALEVLRASVNAAGYERSGRPTTPERNSTTRAKPSTPRLDRRGPETAL